MKTNHANWVFGLYVLTTADGVHAADAGTGDRETLSPVLVKGALDPLQETPPYFPSRSISTVGRNRLESSLHTNVSEHLRGTPGVAVNRATEGRAVDLQLRGTSAGQGTVTLDGVPLIAALPGLSWINTIPAESIGTINVVRGPGHAYSAEQGLAGAIQISTKQAVRSEALAHFEGGSFDTFRGTAHGGVVGRLGGLSMTASRLQAFEGNHLAIDEDGNPENDPYHSSIGLLRYDTSLHDRTAVDGSFVAKRAVQRADFPIVMFSGLPAFVDGDVVFDESVWLTQHAATVALTRNWDTRFQIAYAANDIDARAGPVEAVFDGELYFFNWRNRHRLSEPSNEEGLSLVWGGETRFERGEASSVFAPLPIEDDRYTLSGFSELQYRTGKWYNELGVRLEGHDEFGNRVLVHAGSSWSPSPSLRVRANAGNAFRAVSIGERLIPFIGNPALKPEEGWNADAGVTWSPSSRLRFDVSGFAGRYEQLALPIIAPGTFYLYVNVPDAHIIGAEASLRTGLIDGWDAGVNYTFQHAENLDNGLQLPLRPYHTGQIWAEWQAAHWPIVVRAAADFRSRHYSDLSETLASDAVVRYSAMLTWRPSEHFDVYVRGENIGDDRTRDIFSYDTAGAAVFGGVHLRYF